MSFAKRLFVIIFIIITFMLIVPLITIHTVKADAGMLAALFLFFAVYPVISVWIGVISAKDIKHFWFSPVLIAVLFWIFSSLTYKTAFPVLYSIIYFILCIISVLIASFVNRRKG